MDRHIINLKAGPSKCELFHAATYAFDGEKHFIVHFTTEKGDKIHLKITGVTHADPTGEHLVMNGLFDSCDNAADRPVKYEDLEECIVTFDTSNRKGKLEYLSYF